MPIKSFADFLPSGDEALDGYLRELDTEPGNYGLAMAIGRLSAQTGRPELMSLAYKGLIKDGQAINELADELEELVGALADEPTQRQLYRLLGDAYSKQGRFREAMAAYSYTFGR
jgi:cytochrome c-type biogenesis protein CcmH/NrfG